MTFGAYYDIHSEQMRVNDKAPLLVDAPEKARRRGVRRGQTSKPFVARLPTIIMASLAVLVVTQVLLFLLLAGMAGSCDPKLFMRQLTRLRSILVAIACHFLIMPFVGYAFVVWLFPQSPITAVTLITICTSPSGGFSGFWCSLCNADLALSVAITTASTLACCVMLPLNLYLYVLATHLVDRIQIAWLEVALSIAIVISAVAAGLAAAARYPDWRGAINKAGTSAGVTLMVFTVVANSTSHDPVWTKPLSWFAACSLPCLVGLCVTFGFARLLRLPPPESTTVAIECVYQNTSLALAIALSAFPSSDAGAVAGVVLVYGLSEILYISCFGLIAWKLGWTYAPSNADPCSVLFENYQPSAGDDGDAGCEASTDASVQHGTPCISSQIESRDRLSNEETSLNQPNKGDAERPEYGAMSTAHLLRENQST